MKEMLKRSALVRSVGRAVKGLTSDVQREIAKARMVRERRAKIASYLATHSVRKLQIGCGPVELDGWLNSDAFPRRANDIFLDATEPLPFDDATFDYVQSEHLIPHLTYPQTMQLHKEVFRILKPGGRIRVATSNLWSFASLCAKGASERHADIIRWYVDNYIHRNFGADAYFGGFVINNFLKELEFLYDPETLGRTLEKAGFADIVERAVGESDDPHLRGIESHGRVIGTDTVNLFETFVLEARKPGGASA